MRPMSLAVGSSIGVVTPPAPYSATQKAGLGTALRIACISAITCLMVIGTPKDNHCGVGILPAGTTYSSGCTSRGGVWVTTVNFVTGAIAYETFMKPPVALQSEFGSSVGLRCVGTTICQIVVGAPADSLAGTGRITTYSPGTAGSGTVYIITRAVGSPPTYTWVRALRPWHSDDIVAGTNLGASVDVMETSGGSHRVAACSPGAGNAARGANQQLYLAGAAGSGALLLEEYL